MTRYVGILDESDGVWGVTVPDIPGCVGVGDTPEDAIASATIALREIASHLRSGDYSLPSPTSLTDILSDKEYGPNPATVLIPLVLDAGRSVRANLTLDAGLLEAVDRAAAERGVTRSAFMASAAREKLLQP